MGCVNVSYHRQNGPSMGKMIFCTVEIRNVRGGCVRSFLAIFEEKMEKLLEEGKDILYIGFSAGLSTTYNSGEAAARELREKYPDRKIYTVDTLAASLGQGMIIYYAAKKKEAGATIEEVRDFVENEKLHMCHWFTVDDLNYLKRGGRISAATAAIGTMLSIKPVMHMDNEGHLVAVGKARGRKAALCQLLDTMGELGEGLDRRPSSATATAWTTPSM